MTTTGNSTYPLNELQPWNGNPRKIVDEEGIKSLKASIASHGLLQSLTVVLIDGKPMVAAGRRRLRALNELAAEGKIDPKFPVLCAVTAQENAGQASLAENEVREPMHPADQFEAFQEIVQKENLSPADIAARFGTTETIVKKRLKLANVGKAVMKAFREGNISLEQIQAFAVSDDHKAQGAILTRLLNKDLGKGPEHIREALTKGRLQATDKRVRFITLKLYEEAGGAVERDLFSDGDEGIYITDIPLLEKLVEQQLVAVSDKLKAEGWAWVKTSIDYDYDAKRGMTREFGERIPKTKEAQKREAELDKERDAIYDEADDRDFTDQEDKRIEEIDAELERLQETGRKYKPEVIQNGGVYVYIDADGSPNINRGYVLNKDKSTLSKEKKKAAAKNAKEKNKATVDVVQTSSLTKDMTEMLTGHRTAGIAATLCDRQDVALVLVVHSLMLSLFDHGTDDQVLISAKETNYPDSIKESGGSEALKYLKEKVESVNLPKKGEQLLDWCFNRSQEELLSIMAICAARTIDTIDKGWRSGEQSAFAEKIGEKLSVDMSKWFKANEKNYFGRVNKLSAIVAMKEGLGVSEIPAAWEKLKKDQIGSFAEKEINATGKPWLPPLLRIGITPKPDNKPVNVKPQAGATAPATTKGSAPKAGGKQKVPARPSVPASKKGTVKAAVKKPVTKKPAAKPTKSAAKKKAA